jgi:3-dehydroquinate synthase
VELGRLTVELGPRSYDIVIGNGTIEGLGEAIRSFDFSPRAALVSNPTVYGLYGRGVEESLKNAGFDIVIIIVPDGEQHKSLQWTEHIYTELLKHRLDRKSAVFALGGGVIGDMAGYAASTYMRGIRFVQVPTTLLAQVDSSVGGKTGVNHPLGKNMIGTFWQPSLVWIDLDTLTKTLPEKEFIAGLAEVIKYGVIWDEDFLNYLVENHSAITRLDPDTLSYIIRRSCEIKAEVVSQDEREAGLRAILNYGHTIGHAVETITGYTRYLHGEAVAIGMCVEARLSARMGLMSREQAGVIIGLVGVYGLPTKLPNGISGNELLKAISLDKKVVAGELRFSLPERIGSTKINEPVDPEMIKALVD